MLDMSFSLRALWESRENPPEHRIRHDPSAVQGPGLRALAQGSPQPLPGLCHLVPSAARGSDCPGPRQAADPRDAFSWLPSTRVEPGSATRWE